MKKYWCFRIVNQVRISRRHFELKLHRKQEVTTVRKSRVLQMIYFVNFISPMIYVRCEESVRVQILIQIEDRRCDGHCFGIRCWFRSKIDDAMDIVSSSDVDRDRELMIVSYIVFVKYSSVILDEIEEVELISVSWICLTTDRNNRWLLNLNSNGYLVVPFSSSINICVHFSLLSRVLLLMRWFSFSSSWKAWVSSGHELIMILID